MWGSDGEQIRSLRRASAYPDAPADVDVIETHMSWVFLAGRYVYKLKKPVRYAFLDFSTVEARRRDCEEEVRLNRRLAPDVYLGVVPLRESDGHLHLKGEGRIVDWLVVMRRLPAERMLDKAIQHGTVTEAQVRGVATVLAEFYGQATPICFALDVYRARVLAEVQANALALLEPDCSLPVDSARAVFQAQFAFLARAKTLLDSRVQQGRILEAHGDLRPEHICLLSPPRIIDCLEFNRDFRLLDAVDELSFLSMECERLGASFVGPILFDVYRHATHDETPMELMHFYASHRACLRAKLALWHLREPNVRTPDKWPRQARAYLRLAAEHARALGGKELDDRAALVNRANGLGEKR